MNKIEEVQKEARERVENSRDFSEIELDCEDELSEFLADNNDSVPLYGNKNLLHLQKNLEPHEKAGCFKRKLVDGIRELIDQKVLSDFKNKEVK